MSIIKLDIPLDIVVQQEVKKTITEINIQRIVDFNLERRVVAFIENFPDRITLWENEEYDAIGDWTQKQAEKKIIEILTNV